MVLGVDLAMAAATEIGSDSSISEVELGEDYFAVNSLQSYFEEISEAVEVSLPVESIDIYEQQHRETSQQRQNDLELVVTEPHNPIEAPTDHIIFVYRGEEDGDVPEDVTHVRLEEGTTRIAEQVFRDCNDLKDIDIPSTSGLQSIGYMSFGSCWSLGTIPLPQTLNHIGPAAFHDCHSLTEVSLPSGIRIISRYTFHDCSSLRTAQLSSTLNVICENAFAHCVQLQSIELPEGLQEIQSESFRGCKSLVLIALPSTLERTGENIFRGATLLQEKLGQSNEDIVRALTCRFSNLPLLQCCYSQSFDPTEASRLQNLVHIIESDASGLHVDIFGMSPFHVLALSSSPKAALFQAMAERSGTHSNLLAQIDESGTTALEYLCRKETPEAPEIIRYILQRTISVQTACLGLAQWRQRICHHVILCNVDDIDRIVRLERIQKVQEFLNHYTAMEKISILEQALWKARMSRYDDDDPHSNTMDLIQIALDREACRIQCGGDIVIPIVLSYS